MIEFLNSILDFILRVGRLPHLWAPILGIASSLFLTQFIKFTWPKWLLERHADYITRVFAFTLAFSVVVWLVPDKTGVVLGILCGMASPWIYPLITKGFLYRRWPHLRAILSRDGEVL